MDPLADLDLDVQRFIGHPVELPEHFVNSLVTGWLTRGSRHCAHVPSGMTRVVTADRRGVLALAVVLAVVLSVVEATLFAVLLGTAAFFPTLLGTAALDGLGRSLA